MIKSTHPYFFLERLFSKHDSVFHLSRYVYSPDSLFDAREHLSLKGSELTVTLLDDLISNLGPDQELAIHSNVIGDDGRTRHIPMIDFSTSRLSGEQIDRIRRFLPPRVFSSSAFFESGRSFHAYSTNLLSPSEWAEFLGRLLLVNPRDSEAIIDSRWIGHRLIAGYCSLRLSNNTRNYLAEPKYVSIGALLESTNDAYAGRN
jgi:hypothetical protein